MHLHRSLRVALVASCAALLLAATPMVAQQATGAGAPAEATAGMRTVPLPGAADQISLIQAALNAARMAPTAAQPAADVAADTPLTGPRVRPDIRGVEPRIADDAATAWPAAAPDNRIVISTLALVLIAVIITILVVD